MFTYVFIICLKCYLLITYLLSYPKSRDAIASKNHCYRLTRSSLSCLKFET